MRLCAALVARALSLTASRIAVSSAQLAAAGRIISRLRQAGFDDEQAACVVQAVFLSRSREALRDAWDVLVAAAADEQDDKQHGAGGGTSGGGASGGGASGGLRPARRAKRASKEVTRTKGGGSMNLAQFARLLPLLGDDLPLSRIERLFEEVDHDRSGLVEFDEFVLMVRAPGCSSPTADWHRSAEHASGWR